MNRSRWGPYRFKPSRQTKKRRWPGRSGALLILGLFLSGCTGAMPEAQKLPTPWTFDAEDPVGGPPSDATVLSGTWVVRAEAGTPSPGQAVCQTGIAQEEAALVLGDSTYSDLVISLSFNPLFGATDRAGGIVFRLQDEDNYYVLVASALEDSLSVRKYDEGGVRTIGAAPVQIETGRWHGLTVEATGSRMKGFLDDQVVVEATDETFKDGRIGLWTRSDSETCFDNVDVRPP